MSNGVIFKAGDVPKKLISGEIYGMGGWGTITFVDGKDSFEPNHESLFLLQPVERIGAPPIGLPVTEGQQVEFIFNKVRYRLQHERV